MLVLQQVFVVLKIFASGVVGGDVSGDVSNDNGACGV